MTWKSLALSLLALGLAAAAPPAAPSPAILAAVASADRSDADRAADARRHPAETLAFAGVKPGDRVLEFLSGEGYYTRLLSAVVGPTGQVTVAELPAAADYPKYLPLVQRTVAALPNVRLELGPLSALRMDAPQDVIVFIQGYHDLHTDFAKGEAIADMNAAIVRALKPGGVLLVIDHAAVAGAGLDVAQSLHRIDEADVIAELTAAGLVLEARSDLLRNPQDGRTSTAFEPSIRGRTDQFMLRFRKPG